MSLYIVFINTYYLVDTSYQVPMDINLHHENHGPLKGLFRPTNNRLNYAPQTEIRYILYI